MAEHLWKFKNGIYPVIPGLSLELGEYGYWQDSQWCRVGNIEEIPAMPIVLSKKTRQLGQLVKEQHHVRVQNTGSVEGNAGVAEAGCSLVFEEKHSQFFFGNLTQCHYYSSIEMEVLQHLLKLQASGLWKKHYWLAYYIVESDRFFTLRSTEAGSVVRLSVDLTESTLNESCSLGAMFSSGLSSVEEVLSLGNGLKYAGAKFISLEKKHFFSKDKVIRYNYGDEDLFP